MRAAAPRTAYRSACCAAADIRGSFFVDVMSGGHVHLSFFFSFSFAVLWSTPGTCRSTALGHSPTSSNAAALIFRVSVLFFEAKSHLHFCFSFYAAALKMVAVVRV